MSIVLGTIILAVAVMMMFSALPAMAQPEILPDVVIQPDDHAEKACDALFAAQIRGVQIPPAAIAVVCD